MPQPSNDRPYVQAWLKRLDRQLSGSGRVSQLALALSKKRDGDREHWSRQLRAILSGEQKPSEELIADIDHILAKPRNLDADSSDQQGRLF